MWSGLSVCVINARVSLLITEKNQLLQVPLDILSETETVYLYLQKPETLLTVILTSVLSLSYIRASFSSRLPSSSTALFSTASVWLHKAAVAC